MQAESFERLKRRLTQDLDVAQCMELVGLLQQLANGRLGEIAIQRRTEMVVERGTCVHCGHEDVVRHGRDGNGRQRFRCRAGGCGRMFNGLTGTVLARMRKPRPPAIPLPCRGLRPDVQRPDRHGAGTHAQARGVGRPGGPAQRSQVHVSTAHLHEYLGWLSAIRSPGFDPTNLLVDTLIHS